MFVMGHFECCIVVFLMGHLSLELIAVFDGTPWPGNNCVAVSRHLALKIIVLVVGHLKLLHNCVYDRTPFPVT